MDILRSTAAEWGLVLDPAQLDRFERYYHELVSWNQRTNLTRITGYREVQVRHFLDSLALLAAMPARGESEDARLIDVGTGPGLPGLALKIARPSLRVTLLESVGKKAEFLRHVVDMLHLQQVEVIAERAEVAARMPAHRECYDLVTARALAELPVALELTLPLARLGGQVLLPRKGQLDRQIAAAQPALAALGGEHRATLPVRLPGQEEGRGIVVIEKTTPTNERYPRRPGMPAKRPL